MVYPQLTTAQLLELEQNGIAIASHTHTHPMLDQCSMDVVHYELKKSFDVLTRMGLPHANLFAFPNGNSNPAIEQAVEQAGYHAAFIFDHRVTGAIQNRFAISRLSVNDTTPMWKFQFILSGVHSKWVQWRKKRGI